MKDVLYCTKCGQSQAEPVKPCLKCGGKSFSNIRPKGIRVVGPDSLLGAWNECFKDVPF